jgi:hypothetical protein
MSIISDALKKASDRKSDNIRLRREELSPIFIDDKKRIRENKSKRSLISGVGTLLIIGIAVFFFLSNGQFIPSIAYRAASIPAPIPLVAVRANPAAETETIPRFVLNGIIEGAGESLAMINNSIVKKGDFFLGAQVIEIGKDKVALLYNRKEITLRIK